MFDDELEAVDESDDIELGEGEYDISAETLSAFFNLGKTEFDPFMEAVYADLEEQYQDDLDFESAAEWF